MGDSVSVYCLVLMSAIQSVFTGACGRDQSVFTGARGRDSVVLQLIGMVYDQEWCMAPALVSL